MYFFAIILATLLLDQASKAFVQRTMFLGESIPVVSSVFHITYVLNPGAAFGLLANRTSFFIVVTIAVVLAVLIGYRRIPKHQLLMRMALGLVVGGAVGNLIDRIRLGRVVDFLDFRIWPVFNLADTAIVIGAGLLLIEVWRDERRTGEKVSRDADG